MIISLEQKRFFSDKYDEFNSFIFEFHYEEKTDIESILRYIAEYDSESISDCLKEGREVLELDPFPWEWIYSSCGWKSLDSVQGKTKKEKYYSWVASILNILEEEAKESGKL